MLGLGEWRDQRGWIGAGQQPNRLSAHSCGQRRGDGRTTGSRTSEAGGHTGRQPAYQEHEHEHGAGVRDQVDPLVDHEFPSGWGQRPGE